ncbi:hypothetical protein GCM10023340_11410 [Nocardioides marinquilinus]|uniref:DUF2510 domain-containing protein n=1 Tax=Nocardioides marinquilinus TaxID=1210400 RepID=A0ABP9PBY5_9ACTN
MSQIPPGWYPDQHGHRRWWDGQQWTEHVQDGAPPPDQAPTRLPPQQPGLAEPTVRPSSPPPQQQPPWQQPQPFQQPAWQQPHQQPYQQQPSGPGGKRRRGPLVAGVLALVLLLVGGGVAAVLLLGGDDGGDPDDDPTDETPAPAAEVDPAALAVLTDYFDGVVAGDCAALGLLSPDAAASASVDVGTCDSQTGILYFGTVALEGCELEVVSGNQVDDASARVAYDVNGCSDGARNVRETVSLRQVDGDWRLDDVPGFTLG